MSCGQGLRKDQSLEESLEDIDCQEENRGNDSFQCETEAADDEGCEDDCDACAKNLRLKTNSTIDSIGRP